MGIEGGTGFMVRASHEAENRGEEHKSVREEKKRILVYHPTSPLLLMGGRY